MPANKTSVKRVGSSSEKKGAKKRKAIAPKKLSLTKMFSGHARALVAAANSGADAHETGNIAESGGPFEKQFLKLFADALPPSIEVASGYFMDKDWTLSKQVDFMVCDSRERLQLPPSPDLHQQYVPLTSLHIFGQLKNSATKALVKSALTQVSDNLTQAKMMRDLHRADRIGGPYREEPLSVVVFARGGDPKEIEEVLSEIGGPKPTYILLVQKGVIFARPRPFIAGQFLEFDAYRAGGDLVQCRFADSTNELSGRALLWIFFALLWKIKFDNGNNAAFGPMVDKVASDYPLVPISVPTPILVQY